MQARFVESQFNQIRFPPAPDQWTDPDYYENLRAYNRYNPMSRHTPIQYLPDPGEEYIKQVEAIAVDIENNKDLAIAATKLLDAGEWCTVRLQGQEKRPGGLLDRAKDYVVDPAVEAEVREALAIPKPEAMEF